ncbi:MAG: DUF262 domain-containing protein [Patescibacteria group bacterium]|nr:DUF262 domain-containing protein [Patescibacteria group bacterium]
MANKKKKTIEEILEDKFQKNDEIYDDDILRENTVPMYHLIRQIANKEIIVPRMQRKSVWMPSKMKLLMRSVFKGIPFGGFTMWELPNTNQNINPYRTIIKSEKKIPPIINFVLDGLQRCSTFCAVFSKEKIVIHEKFQDLDLYYNLVTDKFMFKNEIKKLNNNWINLKETYNPSRKNAEEKENFMKKYKPKLDQLGLDYLETYDEIKKRIDKLFGMVNKELKISTCTVDNSNLATDLLIYLNMGVQYSFLSILYSIISNQDSKSYQSIENFTEYSKKKLGSKYFNRNDVLNLMVHLLYPGKYYVGKLSLSPKNLMGRVIENASKVISKITNKRNFSQFSDKLNDAIINLLPLEDDDDAFQNIFIINDFRSKSAVYYCYCMYLFCYKDAKDAEKEEFYQFLGKYFICNIILERFRNREKVLMLDLRYLNKNSGDYNLLAKKISNNLTEQFWKEELPQKLLKKRSRLSDISLVYLLALIQERVFASPKIKVKNWLTKQMNGEINESIKAQVGWLKIFHSELLNKYCEEVSPNSILNSILIAFPDKLKGKLIRNRQPWGWLKLLLENYKGIESTYANSFFEPLDFPRIYPEEMRVSEDKFKEKKMMGYFTDFFEMRARKMSRRIQETFFPKK